MKQIKAEAVRCQNVLSIILPIKSEAKRVTCSTVMGSRTSLIVRIVCNVDTSCRRSAMIDVPWHGLYFVAFLDTMQLVGFVSRLALGFVFASYRSLENDITDSAVVNGWKWNALVSDSRIAHETQKIIIIRQEYGNTHEVGVKWPATVLQGRRADDKSAATCDLSSFVSSDLSVINALMGNSARETISTIYDQVSATS